LKHIEDLLRQRVGGDPDFRLCDYFDLIGGTSTGSIIAAGLALAFSVDRLLELCRDLGRQVFTTTGLTQFLPQKLQGVLVSKFPTAPVDAALQAQIGPHTTLGDAALRTGLMVMTKRLDTASPWPLHNIPEGAFFDQRPGEHNFPNKDFRLWQIVRASTAAPTNFEPQLVEVSSDEDGRTSEGPS
jgi:patatin-like phospholipase/acyl hydrolase